MYIYIYIYIYICIYIFYLCICINNRVSDRKSDYITVNCSIIDIDSTYAVRPYLGLMSKHSHTTIRIIVY